MLIKDVECCSRMNDERYLVMRANMKRKLAGKANCLWPNVDVATEAAVHYSESVRHPHWNSGDLACVPTADQRYLTVNLCICHMVKHFDKIRRTRTIDGTTVN